MDSNARIRSALLDRLQAAARRCRSGATAESGTYPVARPTEPRAPLSSRPSSASPSLYRELAASEADGMDANERDALATSWSAEALNELAASRLLHGFARALEAAAAPEILREELAAAGDVAFRHALLAASIAEGYGACAMSSSPRADEPSRSLTELADELARQCIEATLLAVTSADQLARSAVSDARRFYAAKAGDHARRAEALWSALGWVTNRDDEARGAASRAFAPCETRAVSASLDDDGAIVAWALGVVVLSCARAMLGEHVSAA